MNTTQVIDGKILLYNGIDNDKCERVLTQAQLPEAMAPDWNGSMVHLIDWKITPDGSAVRLEYQIRNDAYAPILDCTLPVVVDRIALKPPTRSKNWRWNGFWSHWQNTKTGERFNP